MRRLAPCLVAAAFLIVGCGQKEPVRLGFIGGLTGRVADLGQDGRNGFQLAVEQVNAAGGIDGRPIEIVARDDAQDVGIARQAARELVAAKVAVIIGPMTSAMAPAVLAEATPAGIPLLSPTVTTAELTGKDDLFLRVMGDTSVYARQSAHFAFSRNRLRKIAAVYDTRNRAYSENWLASFRTAFEQLGGKVIVELPFYSSDEVDHAALVRELLAARPDGLLLVSGAVDTARFAQQVRRLEAKPVLLTVEWSGTERLIELGGHAVDGVYMAQQFDRNDKSPAYLAFQRAYEARFQSSPGFPSLAAYDAVRAVVTAMRRNPGGDLKRALLEQGPFPGIQQDVVFDRFGDSQRNALITIIRDGRFVVVDGGEARR